MSDTIKPAAVHESFRIATVPTGMVITDAIREAILQANLRLGRALTVDEVRDLAEGKS